MLNAADIGTSCGEHQREYLYKGVIVKDPKRSDKVDNYQAIKDNIDLYNTKGVFPERSTADLDLKWAGETYHVGGIDDSNKTGELTFRTDQARKIRRFWLQLKELCGDSKNNASYDKNDYVFDMETYMVAVDKTTVTDAVHLQNVAVRKVGELTVDKEADGVSTFTVTIVWDKSWSLDSVEGLSV